VTAGVKAGVMAMLLYIASRERAGSQTSLKESIDFNKNIKKSGPLIIGDKGLVLIPVLA
jgi:hypothetical protein